MARKDQDQGTGGRGSLSTLEDFSVEEFEVVPEDEALTRSTVAPSKLQPLIDKAREHQGRKMERRDPVQATDPESGEPLFESEPDSEGNPVPVWQRHEDGRIVTQPRTYKKDEAAAFVAELRNAGNRSRLPAKRLSLRIVTDPILSKAQDDDEIRVQFYIVGRTPPEQPS